MPAKNRKFTYPESRKDDVVEDYHGTPIADPYRWLEDADSEETVAWVTAQNKLTMDYLSEIPARQTIHEHLMTMWNFPKFQPPQKKGDFYYYLKNDGLQNQPVFYKQASLDDEPAVFMDPNTFSDDGTVALVNAIFSKDGKRMIYVLSSGGSDVQDIHIRNVETGEDYDEVLPNVRFAHFITPTWKHDNSGFYYGKYAEAGTFEDDPTGMFYHRIYWHTVGTPQDDDVLVYERPDKKEYFFIPKITDDGAYLILNVGFSSANRNRVYYRPIDIDGDFVRLLDDGDAAYSFIGNDGRTFYFQTDLDAPRSRIVAIDVENPAPENWRELVPQNDDTLLFTGMVNNQFIASYMHDAYSQMKIYNLDGTFAGDIPLPGIGSIGGFFSDRESSELFLNFQSFLYPPSIFRYDFTNGELTAWQSPTVDFPADDFETTQVFYPSKDGTKVPMFLTHQKGVKQNSNNPVILYAYGGFSLSMTPYFAPHILEWLQLGGIYAVANIRGGGEYGEEWHEAAMLENRQVSFDDFIAAGEWLIANDYTRKEKLAIMGASNGGLLVSACMLQRPDLYGAVVAQVPVTDMLRYHKFTAGRFWVPEYGDGENNPEHFEFLMKYSPLHNIKPDETYPPTIITSADHDDRVVPMHSKKFTATIQTADSGENPLLLRMETRAGHGMGKSTTKQLDELADVLAFLVQTLNVGG
jgi:prolyl oligopeptidase